MISSPEALKEAPSRRRPPAFRNGYDAIDSMPDDPVEIVTFFGSMPQRDFDQTCVALIAEAMSDHETPRKKVLAMVYAMRERYRIIAGLSHFKLVRGRPGSPRHFERVRART